MKIFEIFLEAGAREIPGLCACLEALRAEWGKPVWTF
jgi:hypothetical protein